MPFALIKKGQFNRVSTGNADAVYFHTSNAHGCAILVQVPFMLGTNANEGSIFTPMMLVIVKGIKIPLSDNDIVLILQHCLVSSAAVALAPALSTAP